MDSEVECVWESEDKVVTGNDTGIRNCRDSLTYLVILIMLTNPFSLGV